KAPGRRTAAVRHAVARPALLPERHDQRPAALIHRGPLARVGRVGEVLRGPGVKALHQLAVLRGEERPLEGAPVARGGGAHAFSFLQTAGADGAPTAGGRAGSPRSACRWPVPGPPRRSPHRGAGATPRAASSS